MLTKENLRIKDSNFYINPIFYEETIKHTITDEDIYDPGRVCFIYGLPFNYWSIILKYNNVVNPFDGLELGMVLYIPSRIDLKKVELNS